MTPICRAFLLCLTSFSVFCQTPTTTTITSPLTSAPLGAPVTLTATVQPATTGFVTFTDNFTILGRVPVLSGVASLQTRMPIPGLRKLRATFSATATHSASTGKRQILVATAPTIYGRVSSLPVNPDWITDLTNDSIPDLIQLLYNPNRIAVYRGVGDGSFLPAVISNVSLVLLESYADLDGDGKTDLPFAGGYYRGLGNGAFESTLTPSANAIAAPAIDANADGLADLVGTSEAVGRIMRGNGAGQFDPLFTNQSAVFPMDLNGDSMADLLSAIAQCSRTICTYNLSVYKFTGPSWTQAVLPSSSSPSSIYDRVEINGDGFDDLAASPFNVLINDGTGFFSAVPGIIPDGAFYDWNGDGKADMITLSPGLTVRLGKGDGTFEAAAPIAGSNGFRGKIAELNGDGRPDLVGEFCGSAAVCQPVAIFGIAPGTIMPTASLVSPSSGTLSAVAPVNFVFNLQQGSSPVQKLRFDIGSCSFIVDIQANSITLGGNTLALPSTNSITYPASGAGYTCRVFGTGASITPTSITLPLTANFSAGAAYVQLTDASATWAATSVGTFLVNVPAVNSVTPSSASGSPVIFHIVASAPSGGNLVFLVNDKIDGSNACMISVSQSEMTIGLMNDAGSQFLYQPFGSTTQLSNSQCSVTPSATAVQFGGLLTFDIPITFKPAFTGNKLTYTQISLAGQVDAPFLQQGTWTSFAATPLPSVVSLLPTSGAGSAATFTSTYSHTGGANQLYLMYLLLLPTPNIAQYTAAGSCLVEYNRISNGVRLINDVGDNWLGPLPGVPVSPVAQPLANSRCQVNVAGVVVAQSGNNITVSVPIVNLSIAGVLGTFLQAQDVHGIWTGMTQFGNWVLPPIPSKPGPSIDNVGPPTGTGSSATFTMTVSHAAGINHLALSSLLIADKIVTSTACQIVFFPPNSFNLINDNGTQLAGSNLTPGSNATLSNSRCSTTGIGASITSTANTRTLSVPVTFAASQSGLRSVYGIAFDDTDLLTHWVQGGIFNITH